MWSCRTTPYSLYHVTRYLFYILYCMVSRYWNACSVFFLSLSGCSFTDKLHWKKKLGLKWSTHSQKKQLTQLCIFISESVELSLYSWIVGLDVDIQWSELFLLRVQWSHALLNFFLSAFKHESRTVDCMTTTSYSFEYLNLVLSIKYINHLPRPIFLLF